MLGSAKYHEYKGCIHIHTTDSDGTKTIEEVAEIAGSAGLDFILVSDHMILKSREAGKEGFYKNTLVLVGYEHNDREDCNHYLLFETNRVLPADMTPQEYVAEGKLQGALGIIAHPDEIRPRLGKYPSYPWLAWDAQGYDGIEIWNQMSEWMEKLTPWNKVALAFSPRKSMVGPPQEALRIWDQLNRKRRFVGVAGVDAHAFPIDLGPFTVEIFPYKVHFRSLQTHLILEEPLASDFETASRQLYDALARCRV